MSAPHSSCSGTNEELKSTADKRVSTRNSKANPASSVASVDQQPQHVSQQLPKSGCEILIYEHCAMLAPHSSCSGVKTSFKMSTKSIRRDAHGHRLCSHNIRKTLCKKCQGGSICEHNLQRNWCKDCGGQARCVHGKQKSRCISCKGSGICQHKRHRYRCSLCAAS